MSSSSTPSDLSPIAEQLDMAQYDFSNYVHAMRIQLEIEHEERMTDLRELQEDMVLNYESLREEIERLTRDMHGERVRVEDALDHIQDLYTEILDARDTVVELNTEMHVQTGVFHRALTLGKAAQNLFDEVKLTLLRYVKRHARPYLEQRELE